MARAIDQNTVRELLVHREVTRIDFINEPADGDSISESVVIYFSARSTDSPQHLGESIRLYADAPTFYADEA